MIARLRSLLGPVFVGVGVWCALGQITLAVPESASVRLATPAPLFWLLAAITAAALVPAWRRRPFTATPALLATLPWWPVPLPPVAFVWAGHMAWVPIGGSFVAAGLGQRVSRALATGAAPAGRPWRSATLAGLLTLAAASATGWSLSARLPGGDEPHYLVITQSLIADGDLKIENNHGRRDYAAYYGGSLAPDFLRRGRDGAIYSIHAPGTAVLVLPAFAAFGYRGAQATIVVLAAISGAMIWFTAWLASRDRRAAWFAWLAVVGSATFLVQSATIFPDGPGALAVAATTVLLLTRGPSTAALVGASALLAAMPWLHTRFAVIAAGLGGLVAWGLVTEGQRPVADRWKRLGVFLIVPVLSAIGWFTFFQVIYGTPSPTAPYGDQPETRLAYVPGGVLGLLLDEQFGLLTYTPVLVAVVAALRVRRGSLEDRSLWGAMSVLLVYLMAAATYWMWYAGVPATPARFAAVALPALAAPLAVSWKYSGAGARAVWTLLLAVSLAVTVLILSVGGGSLAWNTRGLHAAWLVWLNGVVDLSRGWPSFFWALTPGDVSTELHFGWHVLSWVAIFGVSGVLVVRLRRRSSREDSHALAAVWWMLSALMVAVQCGWWWNGVAATDPATSQGAFLRATLAGQPAVRIAPFSVEHVDDVSRVVRMRAIRSDYPIESDVAQGFIADLPPGAYEVRVRDRAPRPGALSFRIGQASQPWRTLPLAGRTEQTVELWLPGGAEGLTVETEVSRATGRTVDLTPVILDRSNAGRAVSHARFGSAEVFFLDRSVFVEPDGFWVRGGQSADIVVAAGGGQSAVRFELTNGATPNAIRVSGEELRLGAAESRALSVPLSPAGSARVRIDSPEGFRPAPLGSAGDNRFLGVRVRVLD